MRVILLQDIPKVGRKNEVKEVNNGFARNFLFPRKLAAPASEGAIKKLTLEKEKLEKKLSQEYQNNQNTIERLKSMVLEFRMKIGEMGKTFGSLTAAQIQEALKKQGIAIEKDWLGLEDHVKTTGERSIKIKFPQGLVGEIKIKIEPE